MTKESKITAQGMRQDIPNQLDALRDAIVELRDEELETISGGVVIQSAAPDDPLYNALSGGKPMQRGGIAERCVVKSWNDHHGFLGKDVTKMHKERITYRDGHREYEVVKGSHGL